MKRNNTLINLGLVFTMLFCMAFACGDGKEQGGGATKDDDGTTTRGTTRETADGGGGDSIMTTDAGVGAPYDARDPRICPDAKSPTRGAMTDALAKQYVICGLEHVYSQNLYLVENLSVKVGGAIPYNPNNFPYATDIDPNAPVYPIRAGFDKYQCYAVSAISEDKGKNCTIYPAPKATGVCVKTTFGDWRCSITSSDDSKARQFNVPPPQ